MPTIIGRTGIAPLLAKGAGKSMAMPERQETAPSAGRDWLLLGLLVLLVLPLRCWLLYKSEFIARDGIGYIRYALAFEQKPWSQVWQEQDQHPGYPLAIWAVSVPVRAWTGHTDAAAMQFSAQLVSALAALLLLYPMYHLGRLLLGRQAGFWGSLLFQCWPVSSHHLSDGISDTLFLLFVVSALLQAVQAVEGHRLWRCALCGLCVGLAYLVRPEAALLLPAIGVVLLVQQGQPAWRCSWGRCFACGATLALVAGAFGSIYVVATGRVTNKVSARQIIDKLGHLLHAQAGAETPQVAMAGHMPVGSILVAATYKPTEKISERVTHSCACLFDELNQGFHYVGGLFALLGLWWSFDALRRRPGFWVLLVYSLTHALVLLALAMVVFYVSGRHTMILVLLGSYLAAVGLCELPRRLLAGQTWCAAGVGSMVLCFGIVALCLPKTMQRLHAERAGNHAVGLWLADKWQPGDIMLDDHYWSHFYSGLFFEEGKRIVLPADAEPWCFTVVTRGKDRQDDAKGEVIYYWPEDAALAEARIVVHKSRRNFATHPWTKAPR
jgi:hypothetical protein